MRPVWTACMLGGWLACPGQGAQAQLLDQFINPGVSGVGIESGVTVTSRLRPDYDYGGVRVGSVLVRAEVSEATGYDDNVTATNPGRGSPFLQTRINLQAATDLSRYGVAARLTVDDIRYFDQPKQSATNWTASVGGTYEIGRDTASLDYSHINLNQTPRDLDTPSLDEAIPYRIDTVRAGYRINLNRLSVRPELAVSRYDFDDGTIAGVPYPQKFRNRTVIAPGITLGYELAPRRSLIVVARNLVANYSNRTAGAARRDFNDTAVLAGLDYDGGGPWRYRVLAGYEVRTFSSAAIKTIQAPIVEGTVIYTPTGLTTLTGTVARRIQDSSDETTVGFTETLVKLSLDHEYLRNVLLRAQAGVSFNEYNRNQGGQTLYTAGAGATWLLNRTMRLGASYNFTTRQTSATATSGTAQTFGTAQALRFGSGFSESRYLLQLSFGL